MQEPFDVAQDKQLDRMEIKLAELQGTIEKVYQSSEKLRKYFLWTLIITVGAIAIPLLILPAVLPGFLSSQGVGLGL